jgi:hypothetical protein
VGATTNRIVTINVEFAQESRHKGQVEFLSVSLGYSLWHFARVNTALVQCHEKLFCNVHCRGIIKL